jgi:hypothetical protein
MAAGLGFKNFASGEVLTAADVNAYLNSQTVMVFADAAARTAAIASPQEGMFSYLKDTNATQYYTGSAWTNLDTTGMVNPMTTTGDTIYSSSGSTPARLGIGTTGQVLTVAGGLPSWETPAVGSSAGLVLVKTQAIGSGVSSVSITDIFSSTYDNYLITISGGVNSSGTNIALRMGTTSSGYYYAGISINFGGTTVVGESAQNASSWVTAGTGSSNTLNGEMLVFCPNLAKNTQGAFRSTETSTSGPFKTFGGYLADTTQYTSATIFPTGGSFTGGTIRVYGYANS